MGLVVVAGVYFVDYGGRGYSPHLVIAGDAGFGIVVVGSGFYCYSYSPQQRMMTRMAMKLTRKSAVMFSGYYDSQSP